MAFRVARGVLVAGSVAAVLLAMPATGKAFWCCDWFRCGAARTTYRAPFVAGACAPVYRPALPQTVRYVPQTCYRSVVQRLPVTACRAVTCCDPCTGCPVTTYRPVTTWAQQVRLVPYTTYRIVYSNPCVSYNPCATAAMYPSTVSLPSAVCCPPASTTTLPYSAPVERVPSDTGPEKTFKNNTDSQYQKNSNANIPPIPDKSTRAQPNAGSLEDRTASRPVRHAAYYRLISSRPAPVRPRTAPLNDGGWRPSSD